MKFAIARAGQWFFGTLIVLGVILGLTAPDGKSDVDMSAADLKIAALFNVGIAILIAGTIFFRTWRNVEERRLEIELKRHNEEDTVR